MLLLPKDAITDVQTECATGGCKVCRGPCTEDSQCSSSLACQIVENKEQKIPGCSGYPFIMDAKNVAGQVIPTGYCYDPAWVPKTSQDMYNADVSLSGTRFGGTYPEGSLRLEGIDGAECVT